MSTSPIRLLFVVPDLRFGGAERHVATLLPRMDPEKFIPSLVCIGEEGDLFDEVRSAGIEATALHLGGKRQILRALAALVSYMRRTRPDVVLVWGYNAEILGRIAARIAGIRHSVVWVHAAISAERPNSLRDFAARALIPWTSAFFGVADAQRRFITDDLRCPPGKVRIIHNGVEPGAFITEDDRSPLDEFGVDESDAVVGIVAALRAEKDHATLLRAAKHLLAERPRTTFLLVGDGPTRPVLEVLCEELGITRNVRFVGSRSDVARLLRAMDVFVLCSTTECFPISVLEAMACARPVVCTDVGGVRELVADGVTGYLVPPRAPELLAARLNDVLSNRLFAQEMGRAGRQRVDSEFTLGLSVAAAEDALAEVVCREA
ncbi:MAG: glycosyltransferase [Mycobacterium sp.]|nr:glycosyltransferase [Mycobacterium sp.]